MCYHTAISPSTRPADCRLQTAVRLCSALLSKVVVKPGPLSVFNITINITYNLTITCMPCTVGDTRPSFIKRGNMVRYMRGRISFLTLTYTAKKPQHTMGNLFTYLPLHLRSIREDFQAFVYTCKVKHKIRPE